jgi:hypothetical protein
MTSTKYLILFSSCVLLLLPKKTAQACGFMVEPGEFRFWLMQPDLTNESDLTPFFFASTYLYKQDMYAGKESYPEKNINEWYDEVDHNASKIDIDSLLNNTQPQDFFERTNKVKSNSLFKYLNKPQNEELLEYFTLSKKTEQVATNNDPWGENTFPLAAINAVIEQAIALYKQTHSPFIKLRTAYQLSRLYNYNKQPGLTIKTYDSLVEPISTDSWIKTAGLYQKAINCRGLEYNYFLSKVFDANYNRTFCLVRFDTKDYDSTLLLAKNNHERNVISAMEAFNYPGRSLNYIQHIYKSEPGYKELNFLLLREINKIEDWLVTDKVTDFKYPAVYSSVEWPAYNYQQNALLNYANDQKYASQVLEFMLQVIHDNKIVDKSLISLLASHLAMLKKNYALSATLLDNVAETKGLPANIKTQIQINKYLLSLENGFDEKTENQFMTIINSSESKLALYDGDIMKDQLILYTARKLMNSGDKAKGIMLLSKTRRALGQLVIGSYKGVYQFMQEYADNSTYDEMVNILTRKNKTAFEEFVSGKKIISPFQYYDYAKDDSAYFEYWDINKILDCKASYYIRKHDLTAASTVLKKIPDSFYDKEPYSEYIKGNPFYVNVYHSYAPTPEDKISLNKKQAIEQMIRLQKLAEKDESKADLCYFQLANAWYNLTYYGKDWLMAKQWWSLSEMSHYDPDFKRSPFNNEYYGCSYAKSYYLKAIGLTKDKKLKALCNFMAGICEKNSNIYEWCLKNNYRFDYKTPGNFNSILNQKGIDAKYYQQIVQECELYQSYINSYNRKL